MTSNFNPTKLNSQMPPTTRPSTTQSISITFLLLAVLILAFFPNLFHYIWHIPLYLLSPKTRPTLTPQCPPQLASGTSTPKEMSWFQKTLSLPPSARGSYLVTDQIISQLPEIAGYKVGLLNLFVQHTSCALSLNENWDEDVRADMSDALDRLVPEDRKGGGLYRHSAEGKDDMPAHVKSALIGASVTVPIRDGKLALGTWQGVWYLEFRAARHQRKLVATIQGEKL